ncbi:MAG: hypothetical protein M1838_002038 [Thelocarpon superellum]|nr:MAG: hypothetical protein M1838_002038 [Thelocarpon superellum]
MRAFIVVAMKDRYDGSKKRSHKAALQALVQCRYDRAVVESRGKSWHMTKRRRSLIARSLSRYLDLDRYIAFIRQKWFIADKYQSFQQWTTRVLAGDAGDVSFTALQCLAAAYFAHMHGKPKAVVIQGTALYGKALVQLRQRIEDPRTAYDATNVAAAIALHLYELVTCTNEIGQLQHAGGVGRLIEVRGPATFKRSPDHEYFLAARLQIIYDAGIHRKRCFLAKEEWKTIPFTSTRASRSLLTRLVDIWVDVPEYYAEQREIDEDISAGLDTSARQSALVKRMATSLQALIRWRRDWETKNDGVAFEVPVDPRTSLTLDAHGRPLYPTVLYFHNAESANEILLYNALLPVLRGIGGIVYGAQTLALAFESLEAGEVSDTRDSEEKKPLALPRKDQPYLEPVREICRCVDYHLLQEARTPGALGLMVPLRHCFLALCAQNMVEEAQFLIRIFRVLANSTGLEVTRRLSALSQLGNRRPIEGNFSQKLSPGIVKLNEMARTNEVNSEPV